MYDIIFSDLAKNQFSKLEKDIQNRIGKILERIRIRPFHFIKRVVGDPYFRLRVGDYRVLIDIRQDKLIIFVIEMGHRKKFYKK